MKTKLEPWILYSITAAHFWGLWGVVAKLISDQVSPFNNHLLFIVGMLFTLPLVIGKVRARPNRRGILWGLVAGVLAIIGNVAVYQAFTAGGLAAIVIPLTNLYPLVTIAIALLVFNEKLNWINGIGILLAVPAVVMLSGETLLFDDPAAFLRTIGPGSGGTQGWLLYLLVVLVFWGLFSAAQKETTNSSRPSGPT